MALETRMKHRYTLEIAFLAAVIGLGIAGFSGLYVGERASPNAFHHLHVATSLGWLALLLGQLVMLRQQRVRGHRMIGLSIFLAGPLLVATSVLLSVHSAGRDAAAGRADAMVVQNLMVSLELALLVLLAVALRRNRKLHGALMLSTALLFMGIALFFTLVGFVPGYRIEGPGTFHRFADAGEAVAWVGAGVGLAFFLRDRRNGWPWLVAGACFLLNGLLQAIVADNGGTLALTRIVAALNPVAAFVTALLGFATLLLLAWRVRRLGTQGPAVGPGVPGTSKAVAQRAPSAAHPGR